MQTKSIVSTHGNGSENVSSDHGPQFLRQAHPSQIQKQPHKDLCKAQAATNEFAHAISKQVEDPDLVALSNSDLNLLGEFRFDNTQAQSYVYTDSTIQTEH